MSSEDGLLEFHFSAEFNVVDSCTQDEHTLFIKNGPTILNYIKAWKNMGEKPDNGGLLNLV